MSYAETVLRKLKSGEIKGGSALKTRDESKQLKSSVSYIPWLKKEAKKSSRIIIPKEVAVPFNPMTGEEDDTYNASNKFRPFLSVSTVILAIKSACLEDEELKAKWEVKTGVKGWDVTDLETVTAQDREVFRHFVVPRVFSINATKVNMSSVTGRDFTTSYAVQVKRDSITDQLVGDMPDWMKVAKLVSDLSYEEIDHVKKAIQSAKDGKPLMESEIKSSAIQKKGNLAVVSEEDQLKYRTAIRDAICRISWDLPHNFIVAYELDLDNNSSPSEKLNQFTVDDINKKLVLLRYSFSNRSAMFTVVDSILNGNKKALDYYTDYVELDMSCPTEGSKKEIGMGTSYSVASVTKLKEVEGFETFNSAVIENLDTQWEDMEKRFLASCGIKQLTPEVEQRILNALPDYVNIAESPFATESVLRANAEIIGAIYGDDLLMELDAGLLDKDAGQLDEKASAEYSRKEDIASILSDDDDDDDGVIIVGEDEISLMGVIE